ncbi:centrosomal protein of 85 kDa-like isoform X2 [Electrophorus electricus]|uniref:centrosomal protein of 85 kDa-like isoform X2 n=1 Tax=Electrophorus electricus TaxID=8005 RepID=UPI0015CF9E23|nr:centrosomal protein of 85 kDa-like isoform X2 [Electrophorus electricus]
MKNNTCSSTSSPGWVPGCESAWQGPSSSTASSSSNRGRRHSAASDSGDTGIGTSCSDSVEDHSSSSGTLSFLPLRSTCYIPTAHVMPSPSSSKLSGGLSTPSSPWSSCQLPSPLDGPLDMKDPRPVRRWSSLTRLSGQERCSPSSPRPSYRADPHGSLDRGLLHGHRHDPPSSDGLLLPGTRKLQEPRPDPRRSSPLKPTTLDLSYSALPESRASTGPAAPGQRGPPLGHQAVGGSPIQPAVRTQMWLSEQMEYRPGPEGCGLGAWQQEQQRDRLRHDVELSQILAGGAVPVNTLVKIKEGLLRQRELEIDRQKQQILQLHARIRENELRAQQVLQNQRGRCEDPYLLKSQESLLDSPLSGPSPQALPPERGSPLCCENGEQGRRLAAAELEVIHLNEFLKQNTQKYTEDIKKLEEKMKTRDRYISSLKKKVQREQEQSQEKQQRIETLEKYLADLPSLDEVHTQAQQLEEVQAKAQALQDTVAQLEQSIKENHAQLQEKDAIIESQAQREKELVATVQSLQEKVEKCLEDGVRLPMLDLKHLERQNARLQEEQSHSRTLIDSQKQQIDTLSLELTALEKRLQKEKALTQELCRQLSEKEKELETHCKIVSQNQRPAEEAALWSVAGAMRQEPGPPLKEVGPLLKEMSLCLLDLKALCSVLTQRAQGKEPNLTLLLGIRSMSCSGEEGDKPVAEDGLRAKLVEVCQLRKDIDDLRTAISDRYAQDMGENCVTQ